MFTWGSKYLFTVAGGAFLGAALYGLISGGDVIGVISSGYKGGVGDHTGYAILTTIAVVVGAIGLINLRNRDGDAAEAADRVGYDGILAVATPQAPSYWAPLSAFGMASIVVGVAVSTAFLILGIVVLVVVALEWTVLAWSDRATGDPKVNALIKDRVLAPLELPMMAALLAVVTVVAASRILLAVPSPAASTAVASVAAALIFAAAIFMVKAKPSRSVITGIIAVLALLVLAGGIVGAVQGERQIAHEESGTDGSHSGVEGDEGE